MASMYVRHRVKDYNTWRPFFDAHKSTQEEYGLTQPTVQRDADDPNVIILSFRAASTARAKELAASDDLRQTMMRAGVEGTPEMWFAEDV